MRFFAEIGIGSKVVGFVFYNLVLIEIRFVCVVAQVR